MAVLKRRYSKASIGQNPRGARLWLFDLDNTLHDASWRLMAEINRRMTLYMQARLDLNQAEASALRARYWKRYGATLLGLVAHHGVDAADFLQKTHPIETLDDFFLPNPGLARRLAKLKGERWLVTNAPRSYAQEVVKRLGLQHFFHAAIYIDDMQIHGRLRPKPSRLLWARIRHRSRLVGGQTSPLGRQRFFVDDSDGNLRSAYRQGLQTIRFNGSDSHARLGWRLGRPFSARRPSFVLHQVNSWSTLVRRIGRPQSL
ncbi:MAG: pyrimidine 5'-nucleotidase [Burkholderiaceae bacterium]